MTPDEAITLATDLQEKWPEFPIDLQATSTSFAETLGRVPYAAARTAMLAWAASPDNRGRPPSAGTILRKAAELSVAPLEWDQVKLQLLKRRVEVGTTIGMQWQFPWTCPDGRCAGNGWTIDEKAREAVECSCWDRMIDARHAVSTLDPMVRRWIDEGYVTWPELDVVSAGGKDGTIAEAQMRRKWEAYAARAVEDRVLSAIDDTASLRRMQQAREADQVVAGDYRPGRRTLQEGPGGRADDVLAAAGIVRDRDAA